MVNENYYLRSIGNVTIGATGSLVEMGLVMLDAARLTIDPQAEVLKSNTAQALTSGALSEAAYYTKLSQNFFTLGMAGMLEASFDLAEGKISIDAWQERFGGTALLQLAGGVLAKYSVGRTPTFDRAASYITVRIPVLERVSQVLNREISFSRAQTSPQTVTVYRVEGEPNTRIIIGDNGEVAIQGDKTLFLNFGEKARAEAFLQQKINQGLPGATVKSFEVPRSVLEDLQKTAISETMARQIPNRPFIVDTTKAPNQFGLREPQIENLKDYIIQGTGREGIE